MRDRRGLGNQAYFSQTEDTDMTPSKGGYMPAEEEGGSIGAAPIQTSSTTEKTPEPAPEPTDTQESAASSVPSSAAPAADMMPDIAGEQQGGPSSYGSAPSSSQGAAAGEAVATPIADAPMPTASAGGPSASANAPIATGGGAPANSYAGDDMGWDAAAFAEAGGYDAVLMGTMPPGICPGHGDGQDIFVFIDELDVDIDIVNNNLIQNTEVNLIAEEGGSINIDGGVTVIANANQEASAIDFDADPGVSADLGFA